MHARRGGSRRQARRGFTLLELVVVIVLLAAVTAMAAAVVGRHLPGQQLRRASREVAAGLRYTRARAIASGQAQAFVFDTRTREWTAPDRRHGRIPDGIAVVATGARGEQQGEDTAVVRFFPEGAATGGRFVLRTQADGKPADTRGGWQVDVEWLTGQVSLTPAGGA